MTTTRPDIRPMVPSDRSCNATHAVSVVPGSRAVVTCTLDDEHPDRGEQHGAGVPVGRWEKQQEIKYTWPLQRPTDTPSEGQS